MTSPASAKLPVNSSSFKYWTRAKSQVPGINQVIACVVSGSPDQVKRGPFTGGAGSGLAVPGKTDSAARTARHAISFLINDFKVSFTSCHSFQFL